jgi:hypothetical protein
MALAFALRTGLAAACACFPIGFALLTSYSSLIARVKVPFVVMLPFATS